MPLSSVRAPSWGSLDLALLPPTLDQALFASQSALIQESNMATWIRRPNTQYPLVIHVYPCEPCSRPSTVSLNVRDFFSSPPPPSQHAPDPGHSPTVGSLPSTTNQVRTICTSIPIRAPFPFHPLPGREPASTRRGEPSPPRPNFHPCQGTVLGRAHSPID